MVVNMEDEAAIFKEDKGFLADSQEAVVMAFPRTREEYNNKQKLEKYSVEYTNQFFGDQEVIFGYKDLKVILYYTPASLYYFFETQFTKLANQGGSSAKPDNIYDQLNSMTPEKYSTSILESEADFLKKLAEDKKFNPVEIFGEAIAKFEVDRSTNKNFEANDEPAIKRTRTAGHLMNFELFKNTERNQKANEYIVRIQNAAFFFIDGLNYTEDEESRWMHYILFEKSDEGYAAVGYATLYRFYRHPEQERVRLAHMMLLPHYRRKGLGVPFLEQIYKDVIELPNIYDLTVEDPSTHMRDLRDFVDCKNCLTLELFEKQNITKGYTPELEKIARHTFKITSMQARRIYEILRYAYVDRTSEEEMKSYRIEVKRRLEKPYRRQDKDWKKFQSTLDEENIEQLKTVDVSKEEKMTQLAESFDELVEQYNGVINRLKREGHLH